MGDARVGKRGFVSCACAVAACIVVGAAAGEVQAQVATRYYFKQAMPLRVDSSRVALRPDAARRTPEAERAALAAAGLDAESASPWVSGGWVLYDVLPNAMARGTDAMTEARARVAAATELGFASPVFLDDDGQPMFVTPDVLVGFERELEDAQARERAAAFGAVAPGRFGEMPASVRVTPNTRNGWEVLDAANQLATREDVLFAEPDMAFRARAALVPNDPDFGVCWALDNVGQYSGPLGFDLGAVKAWDITTGSPSIITVVLDCGVEQDHPDINQIPGKDFTGSPSLNGGPGNDCDKHGTAVAGCITAKINNNLGNVGIAPTTRIASARPFISTPACDGSLSTNASWTVDALAWAQSIGARVTNNSNVYGFSSAAIDQKYLDTRNAGLVHFVAAGNDGRSSLGYPSSLLSVNAVGAMETDATRASFSNYGSGLDFSAPGSFIYTTDRVGGKGYSVLDNAYLSGTSFASPYAAGVAALVLSRNPLLTSRQVTRVMQQTARDYGTTGYDTTFGYGLVRADAAVARACLSDFNADTFLTFEDFDAFIDAFKRGVLAADVNADNQVTTADIDAFLNAFERGC